MVVFTGDRVVVSNMIVSSSNAVFSDCVVLLQQHGLCSSVGMDDMVGWSSGKYCCADS